MVERHVSGLVRVNRLSFVFFAASESFDHVWVNFVSIDRDMQFAQWKLQYPWESKLSMAGMIFF